MSGIYIYSEKPALVAELVNFARQTGKEANVIVVDTLAADENRNSGADKIYCLQGDDTMIENYGSAIASFLKTQKAELFAVGATPRGRDIAARVAGYLDCGMISDVSSVSFKGERLYAERVIYGGAVLQGELLEQGIGVVTVPAGRFEASSGTVEIVESTVQSDKRVRLISTAPIVKQGVNLSAAQKVVCVGMAMDKEEDMQMARDLANAIGAEIACTRGIAEERHWLPVESYIGLSGATIKPKLYLSLGVSGQIQHVIGIRESQIIVGINNDEKAPIFRAADYGIVGDMYELVPLLIEAFKTA